MCVNPMADPVANPLANPRPPSTCSTESCNWDLSKVPHWLWVTFLGSLSRGEPLSGSFICIDILGSGLLRRSNLSWSLLPKCFALLYPYFASNFPCRWFLPSLILVHVTTNQEEENLGQAEWSQKLKPRPTWEGERWKKLKSRDVGGFGVQRLIRGRCWVPTKQICFALS